MIALAVIICLTVLISLAMYFVSQHLIPSTHPEEPGDFCPERATVIINLKPDGALRGVVLRSTETFIELGEGRYISSGAEVNTSGRIRVPRTNVLFVQDVTTAEPIATTD